MTQYTRIQNQIFAVRWPSQKYANYATLEGEADIDDRTSPLVEVLVLALFFLEFIFADMSYTAL